MDKLALVILLVMSTLVIIYGAYQLETIIALANDRSAILYPLLLIALGVCCIGASILLFVR